MKGDNNTAQRTTGDIKNNKILKEASPSGRVPRAETRLTVYRSPLVYTDIKKHRPEETNRLRSGPT